MWLVSCITCYVKGQMVSLTTVSQPCHITTTQDHTFKWVLSDQYLTDSAGDSSRGKNRYARFEFFFLIRQLSKGYMFGLHVVYPEIFTVHQWGFWARSSRLDILQFDSYQNGLHVPWIRLYIIKLNKLSVYRCPREIP